MFIDFIYSELKKMYKYIIKQDDAVILSNYEVFPGKFLVEYECNENGVFVEERGDKEIIVDFQNMYLNLFGLYCILYKDKYLPKNLEDKLLNIQSVEEMKDICLSVFPQEYLDKNICFDMVSANEYSLCVLSEDQRYTVFCIKAKDMFCKIGMCFDDLSKKYKKGFEYLYKKYCFENNVLSQINAESLSTQDLLKLYVYFIADCSVPLIDIDKSKSN